MRKKQFKAESKRLLDLMINSIYTHQEIFLREIISNASDAMDKLAYTALTDDKVQIDRDSFAITLTRGNGVLTVSDSGIGMSREEMEENLGTLAKSGSLGFKQNMEKAEDIDTFLPLLRNLYATKFGEDFPEEAVQKVLHHQCDMEEKPVWEQILFANNIDVLKS